MSDGVKVAVRRRREAFTRLRKSVPGIENALLKANMESAGEMAGMMRRLVPVDEGDLRDSITITGPGRKTPGGSEVPEDAVMISTNDYKAGWIEFGTVKAPPQPFWRSATHANRKRAKSRASRALRADIKKLKQDLE